MAARRDAADPTGTLNTADPTGTLDAPTLPTPASRKNVALAETRLPVVDPSTYVVEKVFAAGGVGRILEARDTRLDRTIALKELLDTRADAQTRFVREALVTARLQHPAIIPIYEAGRWPTGELFYVMKLVSGRSLDIVLSETRTLDQRLALLRHVVVVADAVAYAHSRRIVHRDLKPGNIVIGAFGETVVIDWGLAKDLADESDSDDRATPTAGSAQSGLGAHLDPAASELTVAGTVMGTPAYMPLEQAMGYAVDERADVYALGAILYHLLSGDMPYPGKDAEEVLSKVIAGPPKPLGRQRGIPEDLLTIVQKAMARAPESRYRTAAELAEDLRRFETGQIVRAHRYSALERLGRFARRYRAPLLVAVAALAILGAASVAFIQRVLAERDRAEQKQAEATRRADELTLVEAQGALEVDPNRTLAWLKTLSPGSPRWRAARTLASDARERGVARLLRGHTLGNSRIAFSPDGKAVVTASDDRTARIWDLASGASRVLGGHTDEVWDAVFSPDGKLVATRSKDRTIRLWDVATGDSRVLLHDRRILRASFSPDGRMLASLGQGEGVRLWDVATGIGRLVHATTDKDLALAFSSDGRRLEFVADGTPVLLDMASGRTVMLRGQGGPAESLATSPDGTRIATVGYGGAVQLWDGAESTPRRFAAHTAEGRAIAFSPDGRTVASTGLDSTVQLLDVASGEMRALRGHEGIIYSMTISPDSRLVATGGSDRTVRVWEMATGRSRVLRGFKDAVLSVAFSPDGALIGAASTDEVARIWDLRAAGDEILATCGGAATALSLSPDGARAIAGCEDGAVLLAPIAGGDAVVLRGHEGSVLDVRASPSGDAVVSAGQDGTVRRWPLGGGAPQALRGHRGAVTRVAISPDGKRLASGGADGTVRLWDSASGEARASRTLFDQGSAVTAMVFSAAGAELAAGGADGVVHRWRDTGEAVSLRGHDGAVTALVASPDGRLLASGSADHTIRLWDPSSSESRAIETGGDGVSALVLFPDAERLASSSKGTTVDLWDARTGGDRGALHGYSALVHALDVSPDSRRLAAAGRDGGVWISDVEPHVTRALHGHTADVDHIAFTPDGHAVVSAGKDGTIRRWLDDLPDDEAGLRAWLAAATDEVLAPRDDLRR